MNTDNIKEKVLTGTRLAIERLLEKKAKENSFVVISEKGNVVHFYPKAGAKSQ